jgi:cytochrome c biogenesis protein
MSSIPTDLKTRGATVAPPAAAADVGVDADEPTDDLGGMSLSLPIGDLWDRIWHLFISMRTGLALMLFLALLTLAGTVLTQVPAGVQGDQVAYAQWLDSVRPKYGGWTTVFDVTGLFSVFTSIPFKITVVLLVTSILACSVNRTPRLWRQATKPRLVPSTAFLDHAALAGSVTVAGSVAAAGDALVAELKHRGYRAIVTTDADGVAVFADRFRWGPFGTVVAHLSLILVLVGAIAGTSDFGGFRNTNFAITIDSTVPVGNGTNLSVKATSFSDSYYDNGSPADYASHLVLYDNGVQVADKTVRVNDPLRYGDISFYQSFFGPAADVVVKDVTGATLFQSGVPLEFGSNDGTKAMGSFTIPGKDVTVWVIGAASGQVDPTIKAGQLQFEVYQGTDQSQPTAVNVLDQGKATAMGGYEITFVRERQFTGLIVSRDPGAPIVWLGALFLILGVVLVFLFPARRLWARVRGSAGGAEVRIAAATRHDLGFESTFRAVLTAIQEKGR